MKEIKECAIGLNKESKFIEYIYRERIYSIYRVQSRGSLCSLIFGER